MVVHLAWVHGLHASSTLTSISNPGDVGASLSLALAVTHPSPPLHSDLSLLAEVDEIQEDSDPTPSSSIPLPDPSPLPLPSPDLVTSPIPSTSHPPALSLLSESPLPPPLMPTASTSDILVLSPTDPGPHCSSTVSFEPPASIQLALDSTDNSLLSPGLLSSTSLANPAQVSHGSTVLTETLDVLHLSSAIFPPPLSSPPVPDPSLPAPSMVVPPATSSTPSSPVPASWLPTSLGPRRVIHHVTLKTQRPPAP
ncbi:hypothetical protein HMI56_001758, partial [Coelomomyces lativittatus]